MNLMNIYPQIAEHTEAKIVGNKEALVLLRDAIDRAIKEGKSATPSMTEAVIFATDGEGYEIQVERMPDSWDDKKWEGHTPYYQIYHGG